MIATPPSSGCSSPEDARKKGWWQAYGTVLTGYYVGLEAAAVRISTYEAQLVPGLLQITDYARAVIKAARPEITVELLNKRIEVRIIRQSLLSQEDPLRVQRGSRRGCVAARGRKSYGHA